jgi:hypothetical protein
MAAAEAAEEQAFEAQRVARAKRKRFERLQSFLKERGGELIRRGLESVEELEKLEEQEKLNALSASSAVAAIFSESELASSFFSEFDAFLAQEYSDLFDENL